LHLAHVKATPNWSHQMCNTYRTSNKISTDFIPFPLPCFSRVRYNCVCTCPMPITKLQTNLPSKGSARTRQTTQIQYHVLQLWFAQSVVFSQQPPPPPKQSLAKQSQPPPPKYGNSMPSVTRIHHSLQTVIHSNPFPAWAGQLKPTYSLTRSSFTNRNQ
jgi:hypothetical protein